MKKPEEIKQAWDGKQFHQIDNTAYITMEDLGNDPVHSVKELFRQMMARKQTEAKMTERNNTCVVCGEVIPEGRQVCVMCEGMMLVSQVSQITMTEYQRLAARTSNTTGEDAICNGCLGLAGECGEVVDLYKKHRYQGHELDKAKMAEELGDVLWYVAEIASGMGVDLGTIAQGNIDKLRRRYPDGFDAERSLNREG